MIGKRRATVLLLIILCVALVAFPNVGTVKAEGTVYIRADGSVEGTDKIQRDGDVYTLTGGILGKLIIVERSDTVIDGNGTLLGHYNSFEGVITLQNVRNVTIKNCIIRDCIYGIELNSSSHINILGNKISEADMPMYWPATAIHIKYETSNINIIGNNITNNKWGIIHCIEESPNLVIHHNNFVENYEKDASILPEFSATWDNGKEGNYWSQYNGVDHDCDGIGDTPYVIDGNNQDNYPLMTPITFFDAGTWGGENYKVNVVSNSTVSDFVFDPEDDRIKFDVKGERWTSGFCRVTIPKELLSAKSEWIVLVDKSSVTPSVDEDENSTCLYFTYHFPSYYIHSTKTVEIIGTDAIPEFPSCIILPLFATATLAVIICRNRLRRKVKS
jgi:parallel beta-helix repeat protein